MTRTNHVASSSLIPDALFVELYRIHALSGQLLGIANKPRSSGDHVTTAAIVNLIDTWLRAIAVIESPEAAAWHHYEVHAVRLAMHNASVVMLKKLNDALWTRAAHVIISPPKQLRRRSTWLHKQNDTQNIVSDFVLHNPGLSVQQIATQLEIPSYVANMHLLALKGDGRIRIERNGRRHRKFFATAPEHGSPATAAESFGMPPSPVAGSRVNDDLYVE